MTDDIRKLLLDLPNHCTGNGYVHSDLFPVRHDLIKRLRPVPTSVFEFGALVGYFLVTALDAAPSITDVGWVDNEQHTPGSNLLCSKNVESIRKVGQVWFVDRDDALSFLSTKMPVDHTWTASGAFDLVSVDSDHSYQGCLDDLRAAALLEPRWIFVDDWDAISHATEIRAATHEWLAEQEEVGLTWALSEHVTVNGLAVLTRST